MEESSRFPSISARSTYDPLFCSKPQAGSAHLAQQQQNKSE